MNKCDMCGAEMEDAVDSVCLACFGLQEAEEDTILMPLDFNLNEDRQMELDFGPDEPDE